MIALVALGWGGARVYRGWQERRLGRAAQQDFAAGRFEAAGIAAERLRQINPESIEAHRIMARLAERNRQAGAIEWRRRALTLEGHTAEDAIALARAALQFGDTSTAEQTLEQLTEREKETAAYHELAAQLAVSRKDPVTAEREYAAAARLDPRNALNRLNLAVMRLPSSDPRIRDDALKVVEELRVDPNLRRPALRALINDAAARRNLERLLGASKELSELEEATFADRVVYLEALRGSNDDRFVPYLTQLQTEAEPDPDKCVYLLSWMNQNSLALLAIDWAKNFGPKILETNGVSIALAESYCALLDWAGLRARLEKANWGNNDFLRRAYIARTFRGLGDERGFSLQWQAAMQAVMGRAEPLLILTRTVGSWGWQNEAIELYWGLTDQPSHRDTALSALHEHYSRAGDTPNLYRVILRTLKLRPGDPKVKNNAAQLALLLGYDPVGNKNSADALYQTQPKNRAFASTYAFAWHVTGNNRKALQIMEGLSEADLNQPDVAAYYGIFLAAAHQTEKAKKYLDLAATAVRLLPEEKALLEKARKLIEQPAVPGN